MRLCLMHTVRWLYNATIFLQIIHKDTKLLARQDELWGVIVCLASDLAHFLQ